MSHHHNTNNASLDRTSILISTVEALRESETKLRNRVEEQRQQRLSLETDILNLRDQNAALEHQHLSAMRSSAKYSVTVKNLQQKVADLEGEIKSKETVNAALQAKLHEAQFELKQSLLHHNSVQRESAGRDTSQIYLERQVQQLQDELRHARMQLMGFVSPVDSQHVSTANHYYNPGTTPHRSGPNNAFQRTPSYNNNNAITNNNVSSYHQQVMLSQHQQQISDLSASLEREARLRSVLQAQLKEVRTLHEHEVQKITFELERSRKEVSDAREKLEESRAKTRDAVASKEDLLVRVSTLETENARLERDATDLTAHVQKCRDEATNWMTQTKKQFEAQQDALLREKETLLDTAQKNSATMEDFCALEQYRHQQLKDELEDSKDTVASLKQENASLKQRCDHLEAKNRALVSEGVNARSVSPSSSENGYGSFSSEVARLQQSNRRLESENRSLTQCVEMLTERFATSEYSHRVNDLLSFEQRIQDVVESITCDGEELSGQLGNIEVQFDAIQSQIKHIRTLYETNQR
eukprot:PhM_4_TR15642/c0_g1_i1/m.62799